jgi:hypothetical protein
MVSEPTLEPALATASAPIAPAPEPHAVVARAPMPERAAMAAAVAAPSMAAARPSPAAVATASSEGKRQCPKCSLYETELGKVIGWYCRICGWRESRR